MYHTLFSTSSHVQIPTRSLSLYKLTQNPTRNRSRTLILRLGLPQLATALDLAKQCARSTSRWWSACWRHRRRRWSCTRRRWWWRGWRTRRTHTGHRRWWRCTRRGHARHWRRRWWRCRWSTGSRRVGRWRRHARADRGESTGVVGSRKRAGRCHGSKQHRGQLACVSSTGPFLVG